jgi:hypothetical protein
MMSHVSMPAAPGDLRLLLAPVIARYGVWAVIAESLSARKNRPPVSVGRLSDHLRRDIGLEPAEPVYRSLF